MNSSSFEQERKRARRIRARSSYLLFRELHDLLKRGPSTADILRRLYDILDRRYVFGSQRNADWAAESLEWVLRDKAELALKHRGGEACQKH